MRINDTGHMELKPRPIVNISPRAQATVGPKVWNATQRLKSEWTWEEPRMVNGFMVFIHYGGGMTAGELSEWANHVESFRGSKGPTICILVGGDDSAVAVIVDGIIIFFEGDYKMYDASESTGPLRYERTQWRRLGVANSDLEFLKKLSTATLVTLKHRVIRNKHPSRSTGESNTAGGNSVVNAGAWQHVLCTCGMATSTDKDAIVAEFAKLGFKLKLKVHFSWEGITFLKGMWWKTEFGTLAWAPLPSRTLKAGKSIRDPKQIFRMKSYTAAAHRFLRAVADCYATMSQVPVLCGFVQRWQVGDTPLLYVWHQVTHVAYATSAEKAPRLDRPAALLQAANHYGVDVGDLLSLEAMYRNAGCFTYLQHPVFLKMALVDYN